MDYVGRKAHIGIGKQAQAGSEVDPAYWMLRSSFDFDQKQGTMLDESGLGNLDAISESEVMETWSEGNVGEGYVRDASIGLLLNAFWNSVTPNTVAGVTTHTFSANDQLADPLFTVTMTNPNRSEQYVDCKLAGLELSIEKGGWAKFMPTFIGKSGIRLASAPAVAYGQVGGGRFRAKVATIKVADTESGLSGATPITVSSFKLVLTNNLSRYHALGSDEPNKIFNAKRNVTAEVVGLYENDAFREDWLEQSQMALEFKLTNDRETIGSGTTNPELTFIIPQFKFGDWSKPNDLDTLVEQTLPIQAISDGSTLCKPSLVNGVTSY